MVVGCAFQSESLILGVDSPAIAYVHKNEQVIQNNEGHCTRTAEPSRRVVFCFLIEILIKF